MVFEIWKIQTNFRVNVYNPCTWNHYEFEAKRRLHYKPEASLIYVVKLVSQTKQHKQEQNKHHEGIWGSEGKRMKDRCQLPFDRITGYKKGKTEYKKGDHGVYMKLL